MKWNAATWAVADVFRKLRTILAKESPLYASQSKSPFPSSSFKCNEEIFAGAIEKEQAVWIIMLIFHAAFPVKTNWMTAHNMTDERYRHTINKYSQPYFSRTISRKKSIIFSADWRGLVKRAKCGPSISATCVWGATSRTSLRLVRDMTSSLVEAR